MMTAMNRWQAKLHKEKISNAISARRLKDKGWTMGELMDHFEVTETTIKRWFKALEEGVENGDSKTN